MESSDRSIEQLAAEIEELNRKKQLEDQELQKALQEHLDAANKWAKEDPETYFLSICVRCTLLREESTDENISTFERHLRYYDPCARLFVERFRLPMVWPNSKFISFRDFIVRHRSLSAPSFIKPFSDGYGLTVVSECMENAKNQLWHVSFDLLYEVLKGVPVYELTDLETDNWTLLPDDHELPNYLRMKCRNDESIDLIGAHPKWLAKFGFRVTDLQASESFFSKIHENSYEELEPFSAMFRVKLGYQEKITLKQHVYEQDTKLLSFVRLVQNRYYGVNFELKDSSTWTPSDSITTWLQGQGLSQREASAVDLVARPDLLRRGK
jgi:hypothetical protein